MLVYRPTGLEVAAVYWQRVGDDAGPIIRAPWGETHRPEIKRVWLVKSWNPWSAGPGNTKQFQDWQYRRASKAIFGKELSLADREEAEYLQPLLWRPPEQFVMIVCLQFLSLYLAMIGLAPYWSRVSRISPTVRKYGAMALSLPVMFGLALAPKFVRPITDPLDFAAYHFGDFVRNHPTIAIPAALAAIGGMFALILKQFSELEPDNRPAGKSGVFR